MIFLKILNAILGSGLLGLPHVFKQTGLCMGLFILTGVIFAVTLSGLLLLRSLPNDPSSAGRSLTAHVTDRVTVRWQRGLFLTMIISGMVVQEIGGLVSYIYVLIEDFSYLNPVGLGVWLLIVLLLVSSTDLTKLSGFSVAAMAAFLIYKMAFVAIPEKNLCANLTANATRSESTALLVWKGVSTCFFATICHTSLGSLGCTYGARRVAKHYAFAATLAFLVYVVTATTDYFIFPQIDDSVIQAFVRCIPGALVLVYLYKLGILTTIPVVFISLCGQFSSVNPLLLKGGVLAIAIVLANFATSLSWILVVSGFAAGVLNVFIVPAIMYYVSILK